MAFSLRVAVFSATSDFTEIRTNRELFFLFFPPLFFFFNFGSLLRRKSRAKGRRMILLYSEVLVFSLKALSTDVYKTGAVTDLLLLL